MDNIKNFLNISDINKKEILELVKNKNFKNKNILKNKLIGCLYEQPSTRTRISFNKAIMSLGGNVIDLKFEELNYSRKESFEDTFRTFGCYLDGLVFRTTNHQKLIDASKYFKKPIINALSDLSHPCQILADLMTLYEKFKSFKINIVWMGDINNVLYSLIEALNIIPQMKLYIFSDIDLIENCKWKIPSNVKFYAKLNEDILSKTKCVMTDTFVSMNDKSSQKKMSKLMKFQVNSKIMNLTSKDCCFMHCLPAYPGKEVSNHVLRGSKSIIWQQAKNRYHAQKNLLSMIF